MAPLISVIIPCYNCAAFLEETIRSVLAQTFKSYEIIIINDGSEDNSLEILEKYSTNEKIKFFSQDNRGVSAARNAGIQRASGKYFYFLDADDLLHPEAFQILVDFISNFENSVAFMRVARFQDDIQHIVKIDETVEYFWPELIFSNLAPPNAFFFPAHLVHRVGGFNEKVFFAEDWEFLLRIAFARAKLVTINFIGAYYRLHQSSTCRIYNRKKRLYGFVFVKETLCLGLVKRKDLLRSHGQKAFWSAWGTLMEARKYSIPWSYLKDLSGALKHLAWSLIFARKASPFILLYAVFGARPLCYKFTLGEKKR